jgi:nitronate monooxygenase
MEGIGNAMGKGWKRTRFTERVGIEYPLVQGALGGLATQKLTAEVSNFGGLGSFAGLGHVPGALREAIAEIRSLTNKPFAVNLWVSMEDEGAFAADEAAFARSLATVSGHIQNLGEPLPKFAAYKGGNFVELARVLLDEKVPVFSFIYGIPPREILEECRRKGIVTMGSATTADEAAALEDAGVDAVAASGFEAGGHRGSFLRAAEESLTGTFALVPQVVDRVKIPVVAAGGIGDARGVLAAFALGADAVQMGTAFLTCAGSGAAVKHRESLAAGGVRTNLTKGFTGRLARGIQNQLMEELNRPGVEILPYPLQRALVKSVSVAAEKNGRAELMTLWAGQSANLSHPESATEFLQGLVDEIEDVAGVVQNWSGARRRE